MMTINSAEYNGKLPHPFILSKTALLVPEIAVEDLSLDRTATLVPGFLVKDLLLGRTLMMMMMMMTIRIVSEKKSSLLHTVSTILTLSN